jgi:ABC-type glucose/galactose transport system permease subunit
MLRKISCVIVFCSCQGVVLGIFGRIAGIEIPFIIGYSVGLITAAAYWQGEAADA